jgi:hypothetical protein
MQDKDMNIQMNEHEEFLFQKRPAMGERINMDANGGRNTELAGLAAQENQSHMQLN